MLKEATLALAAAGTLACSGGSGGGGSGSVGRQPETPEQPPGGEPPGGLGLMPKEYESDVRDARVPACDKTQPFALETCFDRIVWSDQGDLAFEGAAGRLEVLLKGGVIAPKVAAQYVFASNDGDGNRVVFDRVMALQKANPMRGYWALPAHLKMRLPADRGNALTGRLQEGEFSMGVWVPYPGTATLCGKALPLPLTQATFEEACQVQVGDSYEYHLTTPQGTVHLQFYSSFDMAPGALGRRHLGRVRFVPKHADGEP